MPNKKKKSDFSVSLHLFHIVCENIKWYKYGYLPMVEIKLWYKKEPLMGFDFTFIQDIQQQTI